MNSFEVNVARTAERRIRAPSPASRWARVASAAAASGTRLDWLTESDRFGGFFGKLTESIVVSMYAHDLRSDLENLKRLIERETTSD